MARQSGNAPSIFQSRISKTGINLKSGAAQTIEVTDDVHRFVPMAVVVELTTITAHTSVASLSIGTNSAAFDNILTITDMTGMDVVNECVIVFLPVTPVKSVAPATTIKILVTTPAVATTATARVDVLGYYV